VGPVIRVHPGNERRPAGRDPGIQRGDQAYVYSPHHPHPEVALRPGLELIQGAIGGAVVDGHHLQFGQRLVEDGGQRLIEGRRRLEAGDQHGDFGEGEIMVHRPGASVSSPGAHEPDLLDSQPYTHRLALHRQTVIEGVPQTVAQRLKPSTVSDRQAGKKTRCGEVNT
jgi:hypothetical protein